MRSKSYFLIAPLVLLGFAACCADPIVRVPRDVYEKLADEYQQERAIFREIQRKIQDLSGRTDVSAEGLQKTAARLDDQFEALALEELGSRSRIEALTELIAETTKKAEIEPKDDQAISELRKLVRIREKTVQYTQEQVKQGIIATADADKAESELSEARIRLLDRQRGVMQSAGTDTLSVWNRELATLVVSARGVKARKDTLREQRERLRRALETLPDLQFQEERMKSARDHLLSVTVSENAVAPANPPAQAQQK
jgi:hypothetical protein